MIRFTSKLYLEWLTDCVEYRKWTWPQIAFCLRHWVWSNQMSRRELLDKVKRDYKLASQRHLSEDHFATKGRSFEESYHAIRAAGGDAWDNIDVSQKLAELRGNEE